MKKISISVLLNVILVIIVIGLGVFGYFFFIAKKNPVETFMPTPTFKGTSPPVFKFAIYGNEDNKEAIDDPVVVLEAANKIFIGDSNRVVICDYNGKVIKSIGKEGKYKLTYPYGLTYDGKYIYIANKDGAIFRSRPDGSQLEPFITAEQSQMRRPGGLEVYKGKLYAVDIRLGQLMAFNLQTKKKLFTTGSVGKGKGQVDSPTDLAINKKGEIYVSDQGNNRIVVFSEEGKFIRTVGGPDDKPGNLLTVRGLAFNQEGFLFATIGLANKVAVLKDDKEILKFGGSEEENQKISLPNGLTAGEKGRIYITERGTHRVSVYTPQ